MSPAEQVRVLLAHQLANGVPFDKAWRRAITSLPRATSADAAAERELWVTALRWAKPWFYRRYQAVLAYELVAVPPVLELRGPAEREPALAA